MSLLLVQGVYTEFLQVFSERHFTGEWWGINGGVHI